MTKKRYVTLLALSVAMWAVMPVFTLQAQGKGQGKGNGNGNKGGDKAEVHGGGQGQGKVKVSQGNSENHGNGKVNSKVSVKSDVKVSHGNRNSGRNDVSPGMGARLDRKDDVSNRGRGSNARFLRDLRVSDLRPSVRKFVEGNNRTQRLAAGAVAFGLARGKNERDFVISPNNDRVIVKNRKGDVLVDLDNDEAERLGNWKVNPVGDEVKEGSPSFCRSGAGHPVWGRQWCVNKGFGLGSDHDINWGVTDINDAIVFQPSDTKAAIASAVLAGILGNTVTDRLALHAITLGLTEPLIGRWLGEPNGERVLLVNSGTVPVAEFVDLNRDGRADRMLVALKPW